MIEEFLSIAFRLASDGFRTLIAVTIGYFVTMFFPTPLRIRLHPKEFWQSRDISLNKIAVWFLIGAILMSAFYSLVDPSQLVDNNLG